MSSSLPIAIGAVIAWVIYTKWKMSKMFGQNDQNFVDWAYSEATAKVLDPNRGLKGGTLLPPGVKIDGKIDASVLNPVSDYVVWSNVAKQPLKNPTTSFITQLDTTDFKNKSTLT